MPDFNVRSDSVNVEQIMEQIRARIREKRGVDYTEQQIRELAAVKLEKFLDPRSVRSDLLDQFRQVQPAYQPPELPNYAFGETTLFESHRGPLRWIRTLLRPILKLFFNPNPLIQALHIQSQLNTTYAEREADREAKRRAMDQLYYELVHNLVLELTRTGIEVKNLKMRVESLSSRLEFNERRARALESVVVYKPETRQHDRDRDRDKDRDKDRDRERERAGRDRAAERERQAAPPAPPDTSAEGEVAPGTAQAEGPGQRSRRRRRRRGRRGAGAQGGPPGAAGQPEAAAGDAGPAGDMAAHDDVDGADEGEAPEHQPGPEPPAEGGSSGRGPDEQ